MSLFTLRNLRSDRLPLEVPTLDGSGVKRLGTLMLEGNASKTVSMTVGDIEGASQLHRLVTRGFLSITPALDTSVPAALTAGARDGALKDID